MPKKPSKGRHTIDMKAWFTDVRCNLDRATSGEGIGVENLQLLFQKLRDKKGGLSQPQKDKLAEFMIDVANHICVSS